MNTISQEVFMWVYTSRNLFSHRTSLNLQFTHISISRNIHTGYAGYARTLEKKAIGNWHMGIKRAFWQRCHRVAHTERSLQGEPHVRGWVRAVVWSCPQSEKEIMLQTCTSYLRFERWINQGVRSSPNLPSSISCMLKRKYSKTEW